MNLEKDNYPISTLISDLVEDLTQLFRQEIILAKTEMSENISQVVRGGVGLAMGGMVLFAGFLVLMFCAVLALANVMAPWVAALIVGGVAALMGLVLLAIGRNKLKAQNIAPLQTVESLKRDKELAKEHTGR